MRLNRTRIYLAAFAALTITLSACGSPTPTITPKPLGTSVSVATTAATTAATVAATTAATTAPTVAATVAATEVATQAATATTAVTAEATAAATAVATTVATTAATEAATVAATVAATTAPTEAAPAATQEALVEKPSTLPTCKTSGVLSVGTDATYPPFESVDQASSKIVGFDIDLLTAVGSKVGFTIEPHNAMFDTIFTALSYGQYDLVISASTITAERQQTISFSNPYFVAGQIIIVRKDDLNSVKTTADLAGKTIGVQLGTTGAEAAKGIANTKEIKEYGTAPEAFQALSNGTVDAVVNDNVTSLQIILNSPTLNLAAVGQPFTQEYYGIPVRKDCPELLTKINDGLAAVIADGTYAEIYAKYLGEEPGPDFRKGGAGVLLSVALPEATAEAAATTAATAEAPAATAAATVAATAAATTPAATTAATMAATP